MALLRSALLQQCALLRHVSACVGNTSAMLPNSPASFVNPEIYTVLLSSTACSAVYVAGELRAVDTTLLQAVRTLFVWIVNLLVYAVASAMAPDAADQSQLIGDDTNSNSAAFTAAIGANSSGPGWGQLQQLAASVLASSNSSSWVVRAAGTAAGMTAAAGDSVIVSAAVAGLPGEPWLRWSFLQAAGFIVMVAGEHRCYHFCTIAACASYIQPNERECASREMHLYEHFLKGRRVAL